MVAGVAAAAVAALTVWRDFSESWRCHAAPCYHSSRVLFVAVIVLRSVYWMKLAVVIAVVAAAAAAAVADDDGCYSAVNYWMIVP